MEGEIRQQMATVAGSAEGRARLLQSLAVRQGELEWMAELSARLSDPSILGSEGVAALKATEARPEVRAMKRALLNGAAADALNPAAVEAWVAAHQALVAELESRLRQLGPQAEDGLAALGALVAVLRLVREGNRHPPPKNSPEAELLAEADAFLADASALLRRTLLEWIGGRLGGPAER